MKRVINIYVVRHSEGCPLAFYTRDPQLAESAVAKWDGGVLFGYENLDDALTNEYLLQPLTEEQVEKYVSTLASLKTKMGIWQC